MTKERLISLDVFRGLTILLMTIVNNPGSWLNIYPPLRHSEWNGCTPTDLVFPFFIFIMGAAIPLAMPAKTYDETTFSKILSRSLRMICLGLLFNFFLKIELFALNGIPLMICRLILSGAVGYALMGNFSTKVKTYLAVSIFVLFLILAYGSFPDYETVRLPGVLQRIGIIYFATSLLYLKTNQKTQFSVVIGLLIGYWTIMTLIPAPGFEITNLEKNTNLAAWLDNTLLNGHMWRFTKTWDPEGILSTFPAIATGIIGLLIGQLFNSPISKMERTKKMAVAGTAMTIIALLWNIVFPINKSLWSSSYALFTAGLATLLFSALYYCIDIANYKTGTKLFLIWGVNPMIVFFLSNIIPQAMVMIFLPNPIDPSEKINLIGYLYESGIHPFFDNAKTASLVFALIYAGLWFILLAYFYKKKMFFKV